MTALNGYTFTDAYSLVESGLTAERDGPQGTFLLMEGGDQARDQLDGQLDDVGRQLTELGVDTQKFPLMRI